LVSRWPAISEAGVVKTGVWVAGQIPGSRMRIFSVAEKGSHLMFWEIPELFEFRSR
jgi:hypothetical protein